MPVDEGSNRSSLARIAAELKDPKKLSIVTLALAIAAIGLVHWLMGQRIDTVRALIRREQQRQQVIEEANALRALDAQIDGRLPAKAPTTFWTEYIIKGVRESGLSLLRMTPVVVADKRIGARQGIEIQIDLDGEFRQVYHFVAWLEGGQWPVRVTDVALKQGEKSLGATVYVAVLATEEH